MFEAMRQLMELQRAPAAAPANGNGEGAAAAKGTAAAGSQDDEKVGELAKAVADNAVKLKEAVERLPGLDRSAAEQMEQARALQEEYRSKLEAFRAMVADARQRVDASDESLRTICESLCAVEHEPS